MTDVEAETFFTLSHAPEFGRYDLADEELHRALQAEKPHYSLTETQYLGFSVPEHGVRCFVWVWCHPNLEVVTGGAMAWQGFKSRTLGSELFDFRGFMSTSVFEDSFSTYELDNGLRVEMTEPGRQFRLSYEDASRQNSFEVTQTAVADPVVWPTNNHFEQLLHCTGQITLRGTRYEVDSFTMRDRSFGEYRTETPVNAPPTSWLTAIFDEDFALCVVATDDPATNPIWRDRFEVDTESLTRFGWVRVDGRLVAVESVRTHTAYGPDTLLPTSITTEVIDVEGRRYSLSGQVSAAAPLATWMNIRVVTGLIEWTCDGQRGYGEIQQPQSPDFVQAFT